MQIFLLQPETRSLFFTLDVFFKMKKWHFCYVAELKLNSSPSERYENTFSIVTKNPHFLWGMSLIMNMSLLLSVGPYILASVLQIGSAGCNRELMVFPQTASVVVHMDLVVRASVCLQSSKCWRIRVWIQPWQRVWKQLFRLIRGLNLWRFIVSHLLPVTFSVDTTTLLLCGESELWTLQETSGYKELI